MGERTVSEILEAALADVLGTTQHQNAADFGDRLALTNLDRRDYFAASALQGLLANPTVIHSRTCDSFAVVVQAVALADKILDELL